MTEPCPRFLCKGIHPLPSVVHMTTASCSVAHKPYQWSSPEPWRAGPPDPQLTLPFFGARSLANPATPSLTASMNTMLTCTDIGSQVSIDTDMGLCSPGRPCSRQHPIVRSCCHVLYHCLWNLSMFRSTSINLTVAKQHTSSSRTPSRLPTYCPYFKV